VPSDEHGSACVRLRPLVQRRLQGDDRVPSPTSGKGRVAGESQPLEVQRRVILEQDRLVVTRDLAFLGGIGARPGRNETGRIGHAFNLGEPGGPRRHLKPFFGDCQVSNGP
jgi:hypothetical protein